MVSLLYIYITNSVPRFLQKYRKYIEIFRDMQTDIPCFEGELLLMRGNPVLTDAIAKAVSSLIFYVRVF